MVLLLSSVMNTWFVQLRCCTEVLKSLSVCNRVDFVGSRGKRKRTGTLRRQNLYISSRKSNIQIIHALMGREPWYFYRNFGPSRSSELVTHSNTRPSFTIIFMGLSLSLTELLTKPSCVTRQGLSDGVSDSDSSGLLAHCVMFPIVAQVQPWLVIDETLKGVLIGMIFSGPPGRC